MVHRVLCLVLLCASCGRTRPETTGTKGAPCFANATCFAGLICSASDICVEPGCAGGTCETESNCPSDMAPINDRLCIDRFEASVFEHSDCSGQQYGAGIDDYPPGFRDNTESAGCEDDCYGTPVIEPYDRAYACSLPGVRPSSDITWFQAKFACEGSGKRLCSVAEWYAACAGPTGQTFPYGDTLDDKCNGSGSSIGDVAVTGQFSECVGAIPGAFDLSGNVNEWTADCDADTSTCPYAGGDFGSNDADLECRVDREETPMRSDFWIGFRCCLNVEPG